MNPRIKVEKDADNWYIVTLSVTEDFELTGTGGNLAEALYELAEQVYGGGL
jgi:hypothetical protein